MKERWTPLVALFSAAAAYAAAGGQPPPAPQPPTFRTEANYVRVDAYPTKDGAPVADLTQADFEVLENGAPQRIEQFERVAIRGNLPQDLRAEPNTVRESLAMAANPRARLFVVFLDTYHVDVGASHNIRKPLVDTLDRLIGQDDLVAVMTPEMPASGIAFARKTTTIEGFLARHWTWGERDRITPPDPEDEAYGACYPNEPEQGPGSECKDQNGIAAEMIDRRHEKRTIDALEDLVRYLRGLREERKAVLAISNGWLLYRPDSRLARPLKCHGVPGAPQVGIDPRTGRLTGRDVSTAAAPRGTCDQDRVMLSNIDDDQQFRDLLGEANRANVSFYPVDPRGLATFDTPIVRQDVPGPPPPAVPLSLDSRMLAGRLTALRTLAEATDGLAIVDSNNLAGGMKRIVDDLSSYYLLGYYSNAKLDGRFHAITVRVKRPGVQVRARRGYLAATPAAMTAAARAAPPADPAAAAKAAEAHVIEAAIAPLAGYARDVPLRLQLAAGWPADGSARPPTVWIVGEIGGAATIGDAWVDGFEATAALTTPAGADVASGRATVPRGGRTFRIALAPTGPIEPGEFVLRVSARAGAASIPSRESARLTIAAAPESTGALFVRRGPATANKEAPTADLRFRRNEQLRVEIPAAAGDSPAARLLDRAGNPLNVPVAAARRDDPDGSRWLTAQLALAPLAPGDYVIEIASSHARSIAAFRVVP